MRRLVLPALVILWAAAILIVTGPIGAQVPSPLVRMSTGTGASDTGTQRVVIASDSSAGGGLTDTQLRATAVPVSGTVTAAQATAASLNATVVGTGTFVVQAAQSGTWTMQPGNTANTTAWLVQDNGYSYSHLAANATTTSKSGAGVLHSLVINTKGITNVATVYDNTAGSGTVIAIIDTTLSTTAFIYDLAFATGLTIVVAGGTPADLTVSYR